MKYLAFSFCLILLSCSDNSLTPLTDLSGSWVEINGRKDTITFDQKFDNGDKQSFILKSDKEIKGYNKLYSSIYEYKFTASKISIYNTVSSCYCFADYQFTASNDRFLIENFYSQNRTGQIETFEKIK